MATQLYCYCQRQNGFEEVDVRERIEEQCLAANESNEGSLPRRGSIRSVTDSEIGSRIPILAQNNVLHDNKLYEPSRSR